MARSFPLLSKGEGWGERLPLPLLLWGEGRDEGTRFVELIDWPKSPLLNPLPKGEEA